MKVKVEVFSDVFNFETNRVSSHVLMDEDRNRELITLLRRKRSTKAMNQHTDR